MMSRRATARRKKTPKYRTAREGRSISKDTSIVGVLSFVGVFLFLILMGVIFIDSDEHKENDYADEVAIYDSSNNITKPKKDKSGASLKEKKENLEKIKKEKKDLEKIEKDKNNEKKEIAGLLPRELAKENPSNKNNEINLSNDEKYRINYERAKRSGNIWQLHKLAKWCDEKEMFGRAEDIHRHVLKLSPNNKTSRKSLGYIRLGGNWTLEEDADKLGYYKYKDKWESARSLKEKGLYLYDGEWITKSEARKKGLVFYEGQFVSKKERKELKELAKKKEEENKKQETGKNIDKKVTKKIKYRDQVVLNFRHIKFYAPPVGKWAKTSSGRRTRTVSADPTVNNSQGGLIDTLTDSESGLVMTIQGFSPEILYTFADGSAAQGSEILNLMESFRGEAFNLYDHLDFRRVRRSRYNTETLTQQLGIGQKNNKRYGVLLTFFRYETLTYAINIVYPLNKEKKLNKNTNKKIKYLFDNMRKQKQGRGRY